MKYGKIIRALVSAVILIALALFLILSFLGQWDTGVVGKSSEVPYIGKYLNGFNDRKRPTWAIHQQPNIKYQ